jgi:DNA replication protein DnaC
MTTKLSAAIKSTDQGFLKNLEAAKKRIAAKKVDLYEERNIDDKGREFMDLEQVQKEIAKKEDQEALAWHKNDYQVRFNDCGFPRDKEYLQILMTSDFGEHPRRITEALTKKWIFISGNYGIGKTSLAIRVCWELMKNSPSLRPQFLTINAWINSLMPGEETQSIDNIRRLVVLDDFDKFNFKSEFQIRSVLRLIEHLIHRDCRVIITANRTLDKLAKMRAGLDFEVLIDRVRGKCFKMKISGESRR